MEIIIGSWSGDCEATRLFFLFGDGLLTMYKAKMRIAGQKMTGLLYCVISY